MTDRISPAASLMNRLRRAAIVARSTRQVILMSGGPEERAIYKAFTSRRRMLPIFRLKTFGAAIRSLDRPEEFLFSGKNYELLRRKVRKAKRLGYSVSAFEGHDRIDDILAINRSTGVRQGKIVHSGYTERSEVLSYHARSGELFGVFDTGGTLRAYAHTPIIGEVYLYSRILGDAEFLNDGIMYLLIHDTILAMRARFEQTGSPRWAMYDMYVGGEDGLREFKRRVGFAPARVTWRWVSTA